jgi:predicted RNA binding protein YcfA (HicA-like mRNA interferase family)
VPRFGPTKRRDLIRFLRLAGFEGPYGGGKHAVMLKPPRRLVIPNPHGEDIGPQLLARILQQAGLSREDWEAL